jgi:hypothetical protein
VRHAVEVRGAAQDEAMPVHAELLDAHGRVLEFRLARDRVDHRIDHRAHARVGGIRSFQWMGTNTCRARCRRRARTRATIAPQALEMRASSPSRTPYSSASCGCMSMKDSAMWSASVAALPVRVMVCHWSRTRPVLRISG